MRVFVASGSTFADALTVAGVLDSGDRILLTASDRLPSETSDAIGTLKPSEIIVVGGPAVVSLAVEAQLKELAPVRRLAGDNRYATARAVALDGLAPPPPPDRTLVDGNGKEQAFIWKGTGGTVRATDYRDFAPLQNGAAIIYNSPGKTSLIEDCTFSDIRSQRNSDGTYKTFANDHIIYPGADPGRVLIRKCHLDASKLNGAAVHVYPASARGAEYVEVSDTTIVTGSQTYWAICAFGATEVVLRNVTITGPVRRMPLEISDSTTLTLDNVTHNGKTL